MGLSIDRIGFRVSTMDEGDVPDDDAMVPCRDAGDVPPRRRSV